jgi:transcriptional regulator with XRE-family HTH domain
MFRSLREFRKSKLMTQAQLAQKLGIIRATYQTYESNRSEVPIDVQTKLRKMLYDGPFPEIGRKAEAVTREDFGELKGALTAHIQHWEKGEEKVLQRLEALGQRISELERRAGFQK